MIILNEQQASERLNASDNLSVILTEKRRGNHTGLSRREVGDVKTIEEKQLIAELAIENKANGIPIRQTAEEFGLHPTTVGEYIHGKYTNNPGDPNSVRKPGLKNILIADKVADVLANALDGITQEKLDKSDASELAGIAVKMASTVEKLSDKRKDGGPQIQVNIYSPKLLTENNFTTITE